MKGCTGPQINGNLPMAFDESISMSRKGISLSGSTYPVRLRAIDELVID